MSATSTINGKPRKQLADQLDRLDSIIDALAEGLPGAVADACREGARQAVKDAIIEIVTNPELRVLLAPVPVATPTVSPAPEPTPITPPRPNLWSRLNTKVKTTKASILGAAVNVKNSVVGRGQAIRDAMTAIGQAAGEAVPLKHISLVALGAGVVVGAVCLLVPQSVSALVGGVGAAVTTASLQLGGWLKRAACRFGLFA